MVLNSTVFALADPLWLTFLMPQAGALIVTVPLDIVPAGLITPLLFFAKVAPDVRFVPVMVRITVFPFNSVSVRLPITVELCAVLAPPAVAGAQALLVSVLAVAATDIPPASPAVFL